MSILGSLATLLGSGIGLGYKSYQLKSESKDSLAIIKLYGLDRKTDLYTESALTEKYEWDWNTGERVLYDPELIDFFENGDRNARHLWVRYKVQCIVRDNGLMPSGMTTLTAGFEDSFVERYKLELYYWWHCREIGIRYASISNKCSNCGHTIRYIDEPCPVCNEPPLVKLKRKYNDAIKSYERPYDRYVREHNEREANETRVFYSRLGISFLIYTIALIIICYVTDLVYWITPEGAIFESVLIGFICATLTAVIKQKKDRERKRLEEENKNKDDENLTN